MLNRTDFRSFWKLRKSTCRLYCNGLLANRLMLPSINLKTLIAIVFGSNSIQSGEQCPTLSEISDFRCRMPVVCNYTQHPN